MAVFRVNLNAPQEWAVGDKPDIAGIIRSDGSPAANLLGATIRLLKDNDTYLVDESVVTLSESFQGQFALR